MAVNEPIDPRVRLAISQRPNDAPRGAVSTFCAGQLGGHVAPWGGGDHRQTGKPTAQDARSPPSQQVVGARAHDRDDVGRVAHRGHQAHTLTGVDTERPTLIRG